MEARMNSIGEVIRAYLDFLRVRVEAGDLALASLERSQKYLTVFARQFGHKPLADARRHDLTEFLTAHPGWKSPWTKGDAIGNIITCFRWAEDEQLIERAPYRRSRCFRFAGKPRQPMSLMDYVRIMWAAMGSYGPKRSSARALRRALFFLRRTGCRTCEMRHVRWADVDWEAGVIRLEHHKTARATGDVRVIGLDHCTLRFLRNLRRQRSRQGAAYPDEHIFLNGCERPWNRTAFGRLFRKYACAAGVARGITPYGLRHLFTVLGIENGVGERQLADQLGHTTTKFVAYYGRTTRFRSAHLRGVVASVLRRPPSRSASRLSREPHAPAWPPIQADN
jgi:integrase